jgi:hypothetical protein
MLNNLSEQIRECHRKAEDCARKAAAETDPQLKRDFLDSERRWLLLASSYEFSGRLNDFSAEAKRRTTSVYNALHICRKDGHRQIEYNRHSELPRLGDFISVALGGEQINVRVLNVITRFPANDRAGSIHVVYAVEV